MTFHLFFSTKISRMSGTDLRYLPLTGYKLKKQQMKNFLLSSIFINITTYIYFFVIFSNSEQFSLPIGRS